LGHLQNPDQFPNRKLLRGQQVQQAQPQGIPSGPQQGGQARQGIYLLIRIHGFSLRMYRADIRKKSRNPDLWI
jgi:hypothetical protein